MAESFTKEESEVDDQFFKPGKTWQQDILLTYFRKNRSEKMAAIICLPLGAAGVISGIVTLIARLDSVGTGVELIVLSSLFLIIGFAALSSYLTKLRAIKDDDFTVREVMIEQKILDGAFGSLSLTAEDGQKHLLEIGSDLFKTVFEGEHGLLFHLKNPDNVTLHPDLYFFVIDDLYEDPSPVSGVFPEASFAEPSKDEHEILFEQLKKKAFPRFYLLIPLLFLTNLSGIIQILFTKPAENITLLVIGFVLMLLCIFFPMPYIHQLDRTRKSTSRFFFWMIFAMWEVFTYTTCVMKRNYQILIVTSFILCFLFFCFLIHWLSRTGNTFRHALYSREYEIAPAVVADTICERFGSGRGSHLEYYLRVISKGGKAFRINSSYSENKKNPSGTEGTLIRIHGRNSVPCYYFVQKEEPS